MEAKTKFVHLTLKAVDDQGTIEGYGNTFGNIDSYGDVVVQGAFKKTLSERGSKIKMLYQHSSACPIGIWQQMQEDAVGLKVRGKLLVGKGIPYADQAYTLLKEGVIDGLSIGFIPVVQDIDPKTGINYIKEVKLFEVSIVTFPANEESTVTAVKFAFDSSPQDLFDSLDQENRAKAIQYINTLKQSPLVSTEQPPTTEASVGNTAEESKSEEQKDIKPQSDDLHLLEQLLEAIKQRKEVLR